jgi:adenosylcobinamide-GDP ribazoletransferase
LSDEKPDRRPAPDDNPPPKAEEAVGGGQPLDNLVMAIRFYSRLPTGERRHLRPDLARMTTALPLASLVIGIVPVLVLLLAAMAGLPRLFVAGLAVAAAVLVTGAMAEDALADAADGLFGGDSRERRLEIMKDSRHGTYGVTALCLFLLLRVAAIATMAGADPLAAAGVWLSAMLMARSGAIWLTVVLPPARLTGASAAAGRVSPNVFGMGAVFALILGLVLGAPGTGLPGFIMAVALMAAVTAGWAELCRRRVGGQTGDLIGALQALLELAALTGYLVTV